MATPASASPLPFLETLAKSSQRADRTLWLRIVLDGFRQPESFRASFGPDLAGDFVRAMVDLDTASQIAVVQRLCGLRYVPRALWDAILELGGEPRRLAISRAAVLRRDVLISALDDPALSPAVASRSERARSSACEIKPRTMPLGSRPRPILSATERSGTSEKS